MMGQVRVYVRRGAPDGHDPKPEVSEQTFEQSPFTQDPSQDCCIQVRLFLCHVVTLFTTLWLSCHNVY